MENAISLNIKYYLERLGFTTPPAPTLETLCLLQERHIAMFPFQTLSTVMQLPVSLAWHDMEKKIIIGEQGGYCYELNLLFYGLLSQLGYEATLLSGHVIHDTNFIRRSPRTHILVKVVIKNQTYICDVGHGGYTPTTPLRLTMTDEQLTPHGLYRIVHNAAFYYLQTLVKEEWMNLYGFDLQPQYWEDLEVGNWYVSTHPDSNFRHILMVARAEAGGKRHAILNNRYSLHIPGQSSITKVFNSADAIGEVIETTFAMKIPHKEHALNAITKLLFEHPEET